METVPRSALQSLKCWFPFSLAKHSLIKRGKALIAPSVTSPTQQFIFPVVASVFYWLFGGHLCWLHNTIFCSVSFRLLWGWVLAGSGMHGLLVASLCPVINFEAKLPFRALNRVIFNTFLCSMALHLGVSIEWPVYGGKLKFCLKFCPSTPILLSSPAYSV